MNEYIFNQDTREELEAQRAAVKKALEDISAYDITVQIAKGFRVISEITLTDRAAEKVTIEVFREIGKHLKQDETSQTD